VRILADTNILLRGIHRQHPQHRQMRDAIYGLVRRGDVICVLAQNLYEFWAVCTRPVENNGMGIPPAQASRILGRVERLSERLSEDSGAVYIEWRRLVAAHEVSGKKSHDARLAAAMIVHGITCILTYNVDDFKRYSGITVIHPETVAK
jgi:predicted nucleic acid-binding protein